MSPRKGTPTLQDPAIVSAVRWKAEGAAFSEIASRLGKNRDTVSAWFKSSDVLRLLARMEERAILDVAQVREDAYRRTLSALADMTEDSKLTGPERMAAAKMVLDRCEPAGPPVSEHWKPKAIEMEPAAALLEAKGGDT